MNKIEVCYSIVLEDAEGVEYDEDVVAIVSIKYHKVVKGRSDADNDYDYYGYEELDFSVLEVFVDNGKFDTPVSFKQEQFSGDKFMDKVRDAIQKDGSTE